MGEHDCGDFLDSFREVNAFELSIKAARSRVEVAEILCWHNLSEAGFSSRFPELAERVRELPDENPAAA